MIASQDQYETRRSFMLLFVTDKSRSDRKYEVVTMDVEVFRRSRTFIERYQLLDLLRTIISGDSAMPTEARTPEYFVDQYIHNHSMGKFRHRRWIHADSRGSNGILPHPRPFHRSEGYSVFAEHCEWILNEPSVKRTKMLHLREWEKFCEMVRERRAGAEVET